MTIYYKGREVKGVIYLDEIDLYGLGGYFLRCVLHGKETITIKGVRITPGDGLVVMVLGEKEDTKLRGHEINENRFCLEHRIEYK
jgi:hypothetical protein